MRHKYLVSALALAFFGTLSASAYDNQMLKQDSAFALSVAQAGIDSTLFSIAKKLDKLGEFKAENFIISGNDGQLKIALDALEDFDSQRSKLESLRKSLKESKIATGVDLLGKTVDAGSAALSAKALLFDDLDAITTADEISNIAGVIVGNVKVLSKVAGSALVPIEGTKILVNRSLDKARDVSEQISEMINQDRESFHNQRRALIHNTILAHAGKSQAEIQALVFQQIKNLAAEYTSRYSEGGDMYKLAFGNGSFLSGVAVKISYVSTLGTVQKGVNENLSYFMKFETLGGDTHKFIHDEFEKKFTALNQLAELNSLLVSLREDFTSLQSDTKKFTEMASGEYSYLRVKESAVPVPPKSLATYDTATKQPQYRELNVDSKLNTIENAANNDSTSASSSYWNGNFVLNYVNGSGIFTTFGYGDGGFSAPSKPEANTAATLTYYHLGERNYQVDIRSVDYPGDYSYTAWGSWTEGDQRLAAFEANYAYHSGTSKLTPWVAVQRMLPEDVSRLSGTATYSGVLSGVMIGDTGASGFQSGTGMFGMTANFNNDTVTGAVIVMRSPSSPAWATGNFSTNLNSDIDGGLEFNSQLTGSGISNAENWHSQIRGEFGGPQANEAGGMWAITKTDGSQATGTFHAKKETN